MNPIKRSVFTDILVKHQNKNPLVVAIDPGLKGGIALYSFKHHDLSLLELPMNHNKKFFSGGTLIKTLINLKELNSFVKQKVKAFGCKMIFLVVEKPFKRPMGSVKTYSASVIEVGKILGLFELTSLEFPVFVCLPAPSMWTYYFNTKVCSKNTINPHQKREDIPAPAISTFEGEDNNIKLVRANQLFEHFGFDSQLFFTPRNRLKDGLSDACALLMWVLTLGNEDLFLEL